MTLPEATSGDADIRAGLDALYQHPNVAPFISYRLIQRFMKSNPSRRYVYQCSSGVQRLYGIRARQFEERHESDSRSIKRRLTHSQFGSSNNPPRVEGFVEVVNENQRNRTCASLYTVHAAVPRTDDR